MVGDFGCIPGNLPQDKHLLLLSRKDPSLISPFKSSNVQKQVLAIFDENLFKRQQKPHYFGMKKFRHNQTASYAFVAWIASIFVYVCFITWAYLPTDILHSLGITYYPSRYYAVALPAYTIVAYVFFCVSYVAINMMQTLDPEEFGTMKDTAGNTPSAPVGFVKCSLKDGIPDFGDIDPVLLSQALHDH